MNFTAQPSRNQKLHRRDAENAEKCASLLSHELGGAEQSVAPASRRH